MKNAVITGATKGIGRAIALLFAAQGWNLCLNARTGADLQSLKDELLTTFPGIQVFIRPCDMAVEEQVVDFGKFANENFKKIDVLVNNAGWFAPGNILDEPEGHLQNLLNINLLSAYHLTRVVAPVMMAAKTGHIVNMCSVASLKAYPGGSSYCIAKFGLLGFSKCLREELKPHGVAVCSVMPGAVLTPSWDGVNLLEERFIRPEDIAQMVLAVVGLSPQAVVEEIVIRPQLGDI